MQPDSVLLKHSGPEDEKSGVLIVKEGAVLFVSRPVVDSEMKKPIKGTVFFARLLSPKQISAIAETTHLNVSKFLYNDSDLPNEVQWAKSAFNSDKKTASLIKDDKQIYGFALINDFFSKPAVIIKVEAERAIYAVGQSSLSAMLLSIASSVFIFGFLLVILLERTLVQRLVKITTKINLIKKDISLRLPVSGQDEISTLGIEMNNMLNSIEKSNSEIKSAHGMISTMLNSVGQGFFVFDHSGLIDKNYSAACRQLLEKSPADKYLHDVINYPEKDCQDWIEQLFCELISFESLAELGPRSYPHSQKLNVGLSYYPIRNEYQKIAKVVCIATDITAETQAKTELASQKNYVERIVKIVRNKNEFINFVNETRKIIVLAKSELQKTNIDIASVYRAVHTIKGGAGAFSLVPVQEFSHQFETQISQFSQIARLDSVSASILKSRVDELEINLQKLAQLFEQCLNENKDILGDSIVDGQKRVEIPFSQVKKFYSMIAESSPYKTLEYEFLTGFVSQPIVKSFEYYNEVLQSLASRLGKLVKPIEFIGGDLSIIHENYSELFSSFIHSLRNSIDHGLEAAYERENIGKDPKGSIQIKFSKTTVNSKDYLEIELKDDGRGINLDKIRSKINPQLARTLSEKELLQKVFEPGFSTAEQITEISGRGVGMDAIYQISQKLGGSCEIFTEKNKGTKLKVTVPFIYHTNIGQPESMQKAA